MTVLLDALEGDDDADDTTRPECIRLADSVNAAFNTNARVITIVACFHSEVMNPWLRSLGDGVLSVMLFYALHSTLAIVMSALIFSRSFIFNNGTLCIHRV